MVTIAIQLRFAKTTCLTLKHRTKSRRASYVAAAVVVVVVCGLLLSLNSGQRRLTWGSHCHPRYLRVWLAGWLVTTLTHTESGLLCVPRDILISPVFGYRPNSTWFCFRPFLSAAASFIHSFNRGEWEVCLAWHVARRRSIEFIIATQHCVVHF